MSSFMIFQVFLWTYLRSFVSSLVKANTSSSTGYEMKILCSWAVCWNAEKYSFAINIFRFTTTKLTTFFHTNKPEIKAKSKKKRVAFKEIVLFFFHFRDFIIQLMQQISWTNHTVKSTMELFLELHLIERRSSCKTCRLFEWHSWY